MRFSDYSYVLPRLSIALLLCSFVFLSAPSVKAQSTDQNNPTPVTANQISGSIKARDIGDSRLTSYYYVFTGNRGDVFINVVSSNINGTIDIFTLNGLKPRTKITLFADSPDSETGRVVYMRESERLVLRIQGRSPNDDPGNFQIKFAGSFSAEAAGAEDDDDPKVVRADTGTVRVNSVGTIISEPVITPERTEEPKADEDLAVDKAPAETPVASTVKEPVKAETEERKEVREKPPGVPVVIITDLPSKAAADPDTKANTVRSDEKETETEEIDELTVDLSPDKPQRSALVTISREPADVEAAADPEVVPEVPAETEPEPTLEQKLAKVELRITFKSGGSFSRPMNEVLSVNVIKGVLTIVTSDGRIREFAVLDIEKMTIE